MINRLNMVLLWSGLAVLAAMAFSAPQPDTSYQQLAGRIKVLESRPDTTQVVAAEPVEKSPSIDRISARLLALEQQLASLSTQIVRGTDAPADNPSPDNNPIARDHTESALFAAQLTQAGVGASGMTRDDFRRQSVEVWHTSAQLRDSFDLMPLAGLGRVTDIVCHHSHCDISVQFDDARAAIEQEAQLMAWLASADGACSFQLRPVDFTAEPASTTRQATIQCD